MTDAPKVCKVAIEISESGFGKIVINGMDVSNSVCGFALSSTPGQPTMVSIKLHASVSATGSIRDDDGAFSEVSAVAGRA